MNPPLPAVALLRLDPAAPWRILVNAGAGAAAAEQRRAAVTEALQAAGRAGEVQVVEPGRLEEAAAEAARRAADEHGVIVAAGGDGTIHTVANAAHAAGCALGVLAQGTFNYFARTHGIAGDDTTQALFGWQPQPVPVGRINDRIFLVNASLGLHAQMLEDREAWKARLGRHRAVALLAAAATLFARHRLLRLQVHLGEQTHRVRTPVLFVGSNPLQLERLGLAVADELAAPDRLIGVVLRPVGPAGLFGLALRGALGTLGDADTVERFAFDHMRVVPAWPGGGRTMRVACDGEVLRLRAPLEFGIAPRPLHLLKPA